MRLTAFITDPCVSPNVGFNISNQPHISAVLWQAGEQSAANSKACYDWLSASCTLCQDCGQTAVSCRPREGTPTLGHGREV